MLCVALARSGRCRCAGQGFRGGGRGQWQPRRIPALSRRQSTAGVPQPPILGPHKTSPTTTGPPPSGTAKTAQVPSTPTGNLPPTGTGTASTGPTSASPPPPKRPRRRFRNFFLSLFILTTLGYAGGVYYSLVSDRFHDLFTEYVPYGEDAVAYFEDRAFRKRFPQKQYDAKKWPQMRGENKVTIGKQSGLQPRVAEETGEDLGKKGRHVSAVEDGDHPQPGKAQQTPDAASPRAMTQAVEAAKAGKAAKESPAAGAARKDADSTAQPLLPKRETDDKSSTNSGEAAQPQTLLAASMVDHINLPQATEPVVQELVKMVNNIITAVNASPEASTKFASVIQSMKGDLLNVISDISQLKDTTAHDAEKKIRDAHAEFDTAAKELVRRLEAEMREQESKWREEYENEREKLSTSYQQRLQAEVDAVKAVAEEKEKNALIQQEIELQKEYMQTVKEKVEAERQGRLSKLDELSKNLEELGSLTIQWNSVVDATLGTQHLQVAVEAVKAKVLESESPTPFLNELVALKEVSKDDEVVSAAISSIHPLAYQRGIPSPAHLIDRFRRVASQVRKASLLPEDAGIASHAASAVLSRFMFQKKSDRGLPEGDDVEATLARTEVLLEEGNLDAAAREMNGLKGWAGVLSRDWVGECRRVLEVRQAVDVIATEARLQSLLVD